MPKLLTNAVFKVLAALKRVSLMILAPGIVLLQMFVVDHIVHHHGDGNKVKEGPHSSILAGDVLGPVCLHPSVDVRGHLGDFEIPPQPRPQFPQLDVPETHLQPRRHKATSWQVTTTKICIENLTIRWELCTTDTAGTFEIK